MACPWWPEYKADPDDKAGRSGVVKDEQSTRDANEGMNGQDINGRNITGNEGKSRGSSGGGFRGGRRQGGGGGGGYGRRDGGYAGRYGGRRDRG